MKLKKKLLRNSSLYFILDQELSGDPLLLLKKLKKFSLDIIQLRNKILPKTKILSQAKKIKRLLKNSLSLFIVNDHLDIARLANADGVHLGQDNLPVDMARKLLGKNKIIGISCHSLKQALEAEKSGADYISIGPIYPTLTKPQYLPVGIKTLNQVRQKIRIPFFAIGGINLNNLNRVLNTKTRSVAVSRLLCQAQDYNFLIQRLKERLALK